ncbi:MAG TPA: hypothetical protein VFG14_18210, partial [Chthoniobacteraceae bacterium]|nr:hypothetical protein [Chthoniobacteraceae bacterium]
MNRIVLIVTLLAVAAASRAAEGVNPNDQARFIAGLPLAEGSTLAGLSRDQAWQRHSADLDQMWSRLEGRSLAKARAWSSSFVRASSSSSPCYYFYSGPDILYAKTIFPFASNYVLCGTEPVGGVPDIAAWDSATAAAALSNMRRSINNLTRFAYFITKEMRADLNNNQLNGVTPILYLFLARLGCEITRVDFVSLNSNGSLGSGGVPGVRISFRSAAGTQTLYYFKADLSNGGSGSAVMSFCRRMGSNGLGLLKAASYLMHGDGFSKSRDFLLTNCRVIVQDDSGVPLRYFGSDRWQLRFFGRYTNTTGGIFAKYYQSDLAAAYAQVQPAPLDFQI